MKKNSGHNRGLQALIKATGDKTWAYDKNTRGVFNAEGQKLSRRQFDKTYGLLSQQGFSGFEEKAKTRNSFRLTGFKSPPNFPNYFERSFLSRAEMLDYVSLIPNGKFVFRVKLSGIGAADKYTTADDGLKHIYAEALGYESPSELIDFYGDGTQVERKLSDVKVWTLVAKKA